MSNEEAISRFEEEFVPSKSGEAIGVAAVVGALALYVSVGDWHADFYQLMRWVVGPLSLAIAHRAWTRGKKGWLVFASLGALLFNPIVPLGLTQPVWQLADATYAIGYGWYGIRSVRPETASLLAWIFGALLAIALALTFYVNRYMPRGVLIPTGDIVCKHDGRGDCAEATTEDMSDLDIPTWAKFLRGQFMWTYVFVVGGLALCITRGMEDY